MFANKQLKQAQLSPAGLKEASNASSPFIIQLCVKIIASSLGKEHHEADLLFQARMPFECGTAEWHPSRAKSRMTVDSFQSLAVKSRRPIRSTACLGNTLTAILKNQDDRLVLTDEGNLLLSMLRWQ